MNAAEGACRPSRETEIRSPTVAGSRTRNCTPDMLASLQLRLTQQLAGVGFEDIDWGEIRVEYDPLIYERQQYYIAHTGRVIIAEEDFDDVTYILVQEEANVRLMADTPETWQYKSFIGPDIDSEELTPPSHMVRLLGLADEGIDIFRKKIQGIRRVNNECRTTLNVEIWLFKLSDHFTELRCEAGKGQDLLRKLRLPNFDGFSQFLHSTTPPGSPLQQPGCSANVQDSAEFNSGESHVLAADMPCKHQKEPYDDTRCIVYSAPEKQYRMWTWGHARTIYRSLRPCGPNQQLHKPDEPLLNWIEEHRWFQANDYDVITTLTYKCTDTYFVHTVLVKIKDGKKWQQLLAMRTNGDTGPLRCSKSRFIRAGGKEALVLNALQLDTEDGKAYHKMWKNRRGAKKEADKQQKRDHKLSIGTVVLERVNQLSSELRECKSNSKNDFASRHGLGAGVFMTPSCWDTFLERVMHSNTLL
jgi:hypothetical protein